MKLVALVATVFVFLAACSTDNYIISADEYHIAIQPRNDILYASDQILAAGTMAKAHCTKHGKSSVFLSTRRSRYGERQRFGGDYDVVTFLCR